MKIGIDARMYGAKSTTGIGVYIQKLTEEIFKIDTQNEYYLFLLEPAFSEFVCPRQNIKKVKVDCPWYSWAEQTKMPKILNNYKFDLVHFPHFNVPILYKNKFVTTIHDITPKFFPGPRVRKSIIRKVGYDIVFKSGMKHAQKIITISNHTKDNLVKYFKADAAKIEVIYPGVDTKYKKIENNDLLKTFTAKQGITKPFIFYVGVWRDHKNLTGLIQAFNLLKQEDRLDYQLVLGGRPDPRYPEILKAISDSPFKKDIILPGFIKEDDLILFYNAASLFVLPSFCEGFGLVAAEALACGTPVIGSNTTSLPEILEDGAVYFDPKDYLEMAKVMKQVLTDVNLRQGLVSRGQSLVKRYNWSSCAQKTIETYKLATNYNK